MPSKDDCIRAVMRHGASEAEAVEIVNRVLKEKKALEGTVTSDQLERQLAASVNRAFDAEAAYRASEHRNSVLAIVKRARVDERVRTAKAEGSSFGHALTGLMVGSNQRYTGARESASNKRSGIKLLWQSKLANGLEAIDGAKDLLKKDKLFNDNVMREMLEPDSTGDPTARSVAALLSDTFERVRTEMNNAGAFIGKLDNYAPQNHDSAKLLKAGQSAWVRNIYDRLDFERTFPGITDVNERMAILGEVYHNIVTGVSRETTTASKGQVFTAPRHLASGLEKHRVLHFADAKNAVEYHNQYGSGTVLDAALGLVENASGKLALMDVFGPTPEALIKSAIADEVMRLRLADFDTIAAEAKGRAGKKINRLAKDIESAHERGDSATAERLVPEWESAVDTARNNTIKKVEGLWHGHRNGKAAHYFAALAGEMGSPVNPTAARIASNARGVISMSKLGGAFLSAFADVFIKAASLRHNGESFLGAWKNALDISLEGLQSKEKVMLGRQLGVYMNSLVGDIAHRFDSGEGQSGAMCRAMNTFFKLTLLEQWTEGHKSAYTAYLSNRLGDNASHTFDAVNKDFAASLKRHGLADRWELIRAIASKEADGEIHVLPDRALELSDAALDPYLPQSLREAQRPLTVYADGTPLKGEALQKTLEIQERFDHARAVALDDARNTLARDLMGFYADETRFAVLEPDEKTRAWMYQGTSSGTVIGELARFLLQFKSFGFAYGQRILGDKRWQRASMDRADWDVPGAIQFAVAAWAFGYLSMTAKDLAKGKEPRDPSKPETFIAAALQSGGLGIMGDYFLGNKDRFGGQATASLLGPGLTAAADILPITGQLFRGEFATAKDDALRLGLNHVPFINMWWTRAALDYAFLFHVRENLSPGSLARSERKLREEYNQTYLTLGDIDLTPSRRIKRGGWGFK